MCKSIGMCKRLFKDIAKDTHRMGSVYASRCVLIRAYWVINTS